MSKETSQSIYNGEEKENRMLKSRKKVKQICDAFQIKSIPLLRKVST